MWEFRANSLPFSSVKDGVMRHWLWRRKYLLKWKNSSMKFSFKRVDMRLYRLLAASAISSFPEHYFLFCHIQIPIGKYMCFSAGENYFWLNALEGRCRKTEEEMWRYAKLKYSGQLLQIAMEKLNSFGHSTPNSMVQERILRGVLWKKFHMLWCFHFSFFIMVHFHQQWRRNRLENFYILVRCLLLVIIITAHFPAKGP